MNHRNNLAIIGSGASAIYLLKHLLDAAAVMKPHLEKIAIFEKSRITGMGMPYSPQTTDRYNMSNISSEELPEMIVPFADWLRVQDTAVLESLGIGKQEISEKEVYSRLALGRYLHEQYLAITARLVEAGIAIEEHVGCEITDVYDHAADGGVTLVTAEGTSYDFHKVVIATGHYWTMDDKREQGYYASPWPISKLLPEQGVPYDFPIGTLGASLSAFDVISSLAHRHGKFVKNSGRLTFLPHPGTEHFRIIMHASQGLLPHLQFEQDEPFRVIYRHVDREGMLALVDEKGFLRIDNYFDKICRPVLIRAFEKDGMKEMVALLADQAFCFSDFVEKMTAEHDYQNAFEGMRHEMVEATESVLNHQPIHWKEVIDDLMYTLNYHAELMPAEDHLFLQSKVMPFLMNVIAAMPLASGDTILALYDAGKLEMIPGRVSLAEKQGQPGMTTITVEDEGKETTFSYRMFIDCSGQKGLELDDYPFPALVKSGAARKARAHFQAPEQAATSVPEQKQEHLFKDGGEIFYHIGGVDIDGAYRLIGSDGTANPRIHDIAFPHTSGIRPYSYGLQACNDTSAILVRTWVDEIQTGSPVEGTPATVTGIYEKL